MKTLKEYPKKTLLGIVENEKIYLSAPSWDCGWYWGFGYLGNNNCHYHVDGLMKDKNLRDGLIEHFGKTFIVRNSQTWVIAELFTTFYSLKETSEVLGRGGSHLTANPCSEIIKNVDEVKRINETVLPSIFDAIYTILDQNKNNISLYTELVGINLEGDTVKVIDFMLQNGIHTDDLSQIDGLSKDDCHNIHGQYWKRYHATKKAIK
jgi:hypothetical protein